MKGIIQVSGKKLTTEFRAKIFLVCKSVCPSCRIIQTSRKFMHICCKELPDIETLKKNLQTHVKLTVSVKTEPFANVIFVQIL
ncbi:MAG TPA: hypothetical protein DCZ30_05480 [Clostridiales bacterium]|nr:hypothetical protein [Clostridiales bacterium]